VEDCHFGRRAASQQGGATDMLSGSTTGQMFVVYVEQCLVPTDNDIVVIDNLGARKIAGPQRTSLI
jgi:hypothetical protein